MIFWWQIERGEGHAQKTNLYKAKLYKPMANNEWQTGPKQPG